MCYAPWPGSAGGFFLRVLSILRKGDTKCPEGTTCLCLQGLFFVKTKQTNETIPLNFRELKHNRKFKRQTVNYPSDGAIPITQVHVASDPMLHCGPDRSGTVAVWESQPTIPAGTPS